MGPVFPSPNFGVNTTNNRLTAPAGFSMTYDAAGNLTNDTYTGAGNRTYDAENKMTSAWGGNNQAQLYTYDANGQRTRRRVDNQETWQVYGFDGELLAEYAANGAPTSPQKESGYRGGQLLIVAEAGGGGAGTQNVTWTNAVGVSVAANNLTKTAGTDWYNARASSTQTINSGNGYVEFTASETTTNRMLGLGEFGNVYYTYSNIRYAIYLAASVLYTSEYGALTNVGTYTTGDKLRVAVENGAVKYYKNGMLLRTSSIAPTYPLYVDVAMYTTGSTLSGAVISDGSSSSGSIYWLVADHLGTPRMILDQTGNLANMKRHDYLPFGEELFAPTGSRSTAQGYSAGDGIRQQFTQKERDVETGLDYSIARYYSYSQGRFIGADPYLIIFEMKRGRDAEEQEEMLLEYLLEPQNWAKYNYALNNPLKHTDPTGMRPPTRYEREALARLDELASQAESSGDSDLANGLREARTQIANTIGSLRRGQQSVGINVAVNAILNIGNSEYANSGTVAIRTSGGTVVIGGGQNKCNIFVASTHARGAGLGFIPNGHEGRGYPLVQGKAPVANWLGDSRDRQHLRSLAIVTDGSLRPGDIVAWRTQGGTGQGHSSVHIGGNVLVYAGGPPDGTPQARTLNYVNGRMGGHEPYVVRRYNGKP